MNDALSQFSPHVREWFSGTFGRPTSPQAAGWPAIQRGDHTLILAPTGSGKTLAAFLWGIDQIGRAPAEGEGIRLLYISPLKALNNDIERNLRAPLTGIRAAADKMDVPWPRIRVAVRTGDTSASARAAMVKRPPDILITTPESLYLILTSPKARDILRTVRSVIVDEIHTLVGDKRGAHLALSLERLEYLADGPIQRIGLSATIRPLDEAAKFLGGQQDGAARPVTVIDTGYRKPMDLAVITPVDDFRAMPTDSVWSSVIPQVLGDVLRHRSTLIFCNNRRLAERTADRLNAQIAAERSEEMPPGSTEALAPGGVMRGKGIFAIGVEGPIRAHHGSMARERRHEMEEDLKAGRLPALVGTSSLELGIDIGAVDLVVQLQSPRSVSQGLQRVGRSGHLVGQTSRGRIYTTYRDDLVEAAAVARGMLEGDVEPTKAPRAPLDVLTQQIVAMVSVEPWAADAVFGLVRDAYPYRDLTPEAYHSVLEMLSGKYHDLGAAHPSLRARIAWDRVNDMLYPLPGTRMLALGNAGVITDRGAFDVVLADGQTRVGQLDEEFVFESRAGDAFILGSNVWRILDIQDDRIVVGDAAGVSPRMPFWRGDYPWRPYELGERIARLRREVAERLRAAEGAPDREAAHAEILAWLRETYALDERSAHNLIDYLAHQLDVAGEIAADDAIVIESFTDAVGEGRVVVHSPFGGRVNGAWALALSDGLRERLGFLPETQANDDGILFRLPAGVAPEVVVETVQDTSAIVARGRILRALPDSALFGAHFRMNAARALMLPRSRGRKRTPFWLQRLKARDMLALVRRFADFPLIVETYRDCLEDALDLPHLEALLDRIQSGEMRVATVETVAPSPVAAGLLLNFTSTYMYEWDAPKAERQIMELSLRAELPASTDEGRGVGDLLRPEAVTEVVERAGHIGAGRGARSLDELAVFFEGLGDLTTDEAMIRCAVPAEEVPGWLAELARTGRIIRMAIGAGAPRYVSAEHADAYRAVFAGPSDAARDAAAEGILRRYLSYAGPVSADDLLRRYPFAPAWLAAMLHRMEDAREIVAYTPGDPPTYLDGRLFEQARRRTLAILRKEIHPVTPETFAGFLTGWQHLGRDRFATPADGVRQALRQLRGVSLPGPLWEREVLPVRVAGFTSADLAAALADGGVIWAAAGGEGRRARVGFFPRGEGRLFLPPAELEGLSDAAQRAHDYLREEGASPVMDLETGLGLSAPVVQAALVELALAGLATSDSLDGLHAVLDFVPVDTGPRRAVSALEAELAARRTRPAHLTRPSYPRLRSARRDVRRKLESELELSTSTTAGDPSAGRWSLLHRAGVLGPPVTDDALAAARARVLLERYGVVTREAVRREAGPFEWAALVRTLARMELRGEIRRGYFVAGFWGVQYALPEAVERLRAVAAEGADAEGAPLIVMNALDPALVYGLNTTDGAVLLGDGEDAPVADEDAPHFMRVPSTRLVYGGGRLLLLTEDNGERMWAPAWAADALIRRAVTAYLEAPGAPRRLIVASWNGEPALGGPAQAILQPLGFTRAPGGLERWA